MVHGFTADKDNWARMALFLKDDYRLIAIDLLGHGQSPRDINADYKISSQVQRVKDFANALGLDKFHMAGNSMGGYITAGLALVIFPWELVASTEGYIFTWLIGYSALLGPIAGILIADYFLVRRTHMNVEDLFRRNGRYRYTKGVNPIAIIALVVGVAPNVPGFLMAGGFVKSVPAIFTDIYTYAWFVGFGLSGLIHFALMGRKSPSAA